MGIKNLKIWISTQLTSNMWNMLTEHEHIYHLKRCNSFQNVKSSSLSMKIYFQSELKNTIFGRKTIFGGDFTSLVRNPAFSLRKLIFFLIRFLLGFKFYHLLFYKTTSQMKNSMVDDFFHFNLCFLAKGYSSVGFLLFILLCNAYI